MSKACFLYFKYFQERPLSIISFEFLINSWTSNLFVDFWWVKRKLPFQHISSSNESGNHVGYDSSSTDLLFNSASFKHRLPSERSNESGVLSGLSPIPEAQGLVNVTSGSEEMDAATVSASASCESVTGDSGVFDASSRRTSSSNLSQLETAQVKIGLR